MSVKSEVQFRDEKVNLLPARIGAPRERPVLLRLVTQVSKQVEVKVRPTKPADELDGDADVIEDDREPEETPDRWMMAERSIQHTLAQKRVLEIEVPAALEQLNNEENARQHPRGVWIQG